jgi:hypothetical protein
LLFSSSLDLNGKKNLNGFLIKYLNISLKISLASLNSTFLERNASNMDNPKLTAKLKNPITKTVTKEIQKV